MYVSFSDGFQSGRVSTHESRVCLPLRHVVSVRSQGESSCSSSGSSDGQEGDDLPPPPPPAWWTKRPDMRQVASSQFGWEETTDGNGDMDVGKMDYDSWDAEWQQYEDMAGGTSGLEEWEEEFERIGREWEERQGRRDVPRGSVPAGGIRGEKGEIERFPGERDCQ